MVILTRSEAVVLASFLGLFSLTEEERLIETQDALDDGGIEGQTEQWTEPFLFEIEFKTNRNWIC
jgi:hypothetical protein